MTDGIDWDRDMTSKEVFKLPPHVAKLRTITSLTRKVQYLEEAARSAKSARALDRKQFKSRNALRNWNDPALKLWRWSDGEVDKWSKRDARNPEGPNEKLMERWFDADEAIKALQDTSLPGLEQTIREKDIVIAKLEKQILNLMDQLDRANRRVL